MKTAKTILIVILSILLVLSIGLSVYLFIDRNKEKDPSITIDPNMSESEVVQYLKDQLTQTQQQLTDSNILLQGYLKQLEETNNNNATLTEQNKTLTSTIESLQETVKSLNAEIQRLTKLLEEYGNIAEGTWEVHFYDGEEMIKLLLIRNNSKIAETVTAEKDGFDFKGWATEQGGQVVDYQNIEITQAMNFYAVFERITGLFNNQGIRIKTWDELVSQGDITVVDNSIKAAEKSLEGYLKMPDSITTIMRSAFEECQYLTGVDCYGVTFIDNFGFCNCLRMREIHYSEEEIYLEDNAFSCADSLTSITLPKNTTISYFGFIAPKSLVEIINNSTFSNEEMKEMMVWTPITYTFRYLDGMHTGESRIQTIDGVKYYIYQDQTVAVGAADFRENIKLIDECDRVEQYAFAYQDQIKHVALNEEPNGRGSHVCLGDWSFGFCSGLQTVWVPVGLINATRSDWGATPFGCSSPTTLYTGTPSSSDISFERRIKDFLTYSGDDPAQRITKYEKDWVRGDYLYKFGF